MLREDGETVFLWLADKPTSNMHIVHCKSKNLLVKLMSLCPDFFFRIVFNVRIIEHLLVKLMSLCPEFFFSDYLQCEDNHYILSRCPASNSLL